MDVFAIVVGVGSIILGVVAILVSLYLKGESDKANQEARKMNRETHALLIEIRSKADGFFEFAATELHAYGDVSRRVMLGSQAEMDNVNVSMQKEPETTSATQSPTCSADSSSEEKQS